MKHINALFMEISELIYTYSIEGVPKEIVTQFHWETFFIILWCVLLIWPMKVMINPIVFLFYFYFLWFFSFHVLVSGGGHAIWPRLTQTHLYSSLFRLYPCAWLFSACSASPHYLTLQTPCHALMVIAADPLMMAGAQPVGVGAAAALVGTLTSSPAAAAASATMGLARKIPNNAYSVEYFDRNKQVLTSLFIRHF